MKRINIITKNNGVGLWQDYLILKSALEKHYDIACIDWEGSNHGYPADCNIHLEHIRKEHLRLAPINISIPNPEWFEIKNWLRYIPAMNYIFAKTHDTERIFSSINRNTIYTSFTSVDKYDKSIPRKNAFFHSSGKSHTKGTPQIVKAWNSGKIDNELLLLSTYAINQVSEKVKLFIGYLENEKFNILLNHYRFHLCCSQYEGFGHYINESRSVGAIILATNAAPMNEFVNDSSGMLVGCSHGGKMQYGNLYNVHHDDLVNKCNHLLSLTESELNKKSDCSRQKFVDNDKFFRENIVTLMKNIL